jgi:hypothetical protein
LINLAAFQVGWFACVLGGSLVGAVVVGAILALHLSSLAYPGEWRWLAGFDLGNQPRLMGALPLWLWLLWPLFASLLHHSLAWLWRYPWLAMLGGATSGPLSYFAGARLAGVELAPWLLPLEALAWALICLTLSRYLGGHRGAVAQTTR